MSSRDYNNLVIQAYASGVTPLAGPEDELARAHGLRHSTGYPGGLYLDAEFTVPRRVAEYWAVSGAKRIVFRNGLRIVYEGAVEDLDGALQASGQAVRVSLSGYWGLLMNRRRWYKIWADDRLTDAVWVWGETANGAELCTIDRYNRIRFTPKGVAWANADLVRVVYTMPTGETIKRVTLNYAFAEGAQVWELRLRDTVGGVDIWSITSSGTGSRDDTLATPRQTLNFNLISRAAQTPTEDGTYYGQISSVMVYSETGNIDLTEIVKDVRAKLTELNASEQLIGSNTLALAPFYTSGPETMAEIVIRAASYGDASFNPWAVGLLDSEQAATPDGKPVIFCEQQPVLTDYEYTVRVGDFNLVAPCDVNKDYSEIYNWVTVKYTDSTGKIKYITPDDDANLKNQQSIDDYQQRDSPVLDSPSASATTATNYGRRFLAAQKDPKYTMSSALKVVGYIRGKGGNIIPASEIRAGKRIRLENFRSDLTGDNLTFLVTSTQYDDTSETCSIQAGVPSKLPVFLARINKKAGR